VDEDRFLRALSVNPDDDVARLVYADWLDERADPRAGFLRLERDLVALPAEDERRPEWKARLQQQARTLDPAWLRVVSRPDIENCELRFDFKCPLSWEKLQPTDNPAVRFCESCGKRVHYCETVDEARRLAARFGHCVAIDLRQPRRDGDLEMFTATMGIIASQELQLRRADDEESGPPRPGRKRR
jgi:uncharacterized protein (TIGR02996 family)